MDVRVVTAPVDGQRKRRSRSWMVVAQGLAELMRGGWIWTGGGVMVMMFLVVSSYKQVNNYIMRSKIPSQSGVNV